MPHLKVSELVSGGIVAILFGILYQVGAGIEKSISVWLSAPTLGLNVLLPNAAIIIGVLAIAYGAYLLREHKPQPGQTSPIGLKDSQEMFRSSIHRDGSIVSDSETGKTILSINHPSRSYAMLYAVNHNSVEGGGLKASVRVTPKTLYRFGLGVWTSVNPLTSFNRLGILEVDNDAFRITYTRYEPSEVGGGGRDFDMAPPKVDETYILELEINWAGDAITGRVFDRKGNLLKDMRIPRTVPSGVLTDVWAGVAVWTDEVGCPLSSYEVEAFEIF